MSKRDTGRLIREAVADNLFFTAKEILGFRDMAEKPHGRWCEMLERKPRRLMMLAPRKHFKSTVFTISYTIWRLLLNRDLRILIITEDMGLASEFVKVIRTMFERKTILRKHFNGGRTFRTRADDWTKYSITLQRKAILKEPSITAIGVGGNVVGGSYDLVILDDVVTRKDTRSPRIRDDKIAFFKAIQGVIDPIQGEQIIVGTRWHYGDLYGYVLGERDHDGEICDAEFETHVEPAVDKKTGEYLFPTRFDAEILATTKRIMGAVVYAAQMLLDPSGWTGRIWKRKWFRFTDTVPAGLENMTLTIDPAVKDKEQSDFFGFTMGGTRGDGDDRLGFVTATWEEHMTAPQCVEEAVNLAQVHGIRKIGVECVAAQEWLADLIENRVRKLHLAVDVCRIPRKTDKVSWAHENTRHVESRRVFFLRGPTKTLVKQLVEFPDAANDDVHDSFLGWLEVAMDGKHMPVDETIPTDAPIGASARG